MLYKRGFKQKNKQGDILKRRKNKFHFNRYYLYAKEPKTYRMQT